MKEKVCIYTYCKINKRDLITYQSLSKLCTFIIV